MAVTPFSSIFRVVENFLMGAEFFSYDFQESRQTVAAYYVGAPRKTNSFESFWSLQKGGGCKLLYAQRLLRYDTVNTATLLSSNQLGSYRQWSAQISL
jgi:hypothetical protein